jgi:glycosyltransferase involved in cell wall biosynthesis
LQTSKQISHLNFAKGFRGGERQTFLLIEELSKRGYQQQIITRKNSELAKRLKNIPNLSIIEISKPHIFHLAKIKDASLLHAHETKAAQVSLFANLLLQIPYIVTRRVDIKIKENFFNRSIYQNSLYTIVLSKAIKKRVLNLSSTVKTKIIPSCATEFHYDIDNIQKIKSNYANKFIIGNIGALEHAKGQQYLLEVAKRVQHKYPNIHFLFLGTGKNEAEFREIAKNLPNVTFEGFVNNVGDYIKTFDLFAFPSLHEGLGSILLDVIQAKVPIAASNVGGIPDIISHEKTGLLFDPKDTNAIYNTIEKLYLSENLREQLVEEAYKTIENFSITKMADTYEKVYKA